MPTTIAVPLPPDVDEALTALVEETGRSKESLVGKTIHSDLKQLERSFLFANLCEEHRTGQKQPYTEEQIRADLDLEGSGMSGADLRTVPMGAPPNQQNDISTINLSLPRAADNLLTKLAKESGRSREYLIQVALLLNLETLDDTLWAIQISKEDRSGQRTYTAEEVHAHLGLS